ncbi:MAG: twin-arginine translocation signal domain-containing protein, partial [Candidatus Latescibacter sp.]|nr:twin-arginine translocation signal domain-containing protein [Candidatus Latescibacter sp.]
MHTTRRKFLGLSAMAVSGTAIGVDAAEPKKRTASDLLKVGVILGEYPHSTGWAALANGINGAATTPNRTGMIYTHVWHIKNEEAAAFAKRYGVDTVVRNFDDMVGKVDGLIIDTVMQTPWVHRLAEPYLTNGVPVFSDRPGSDAVWKVKKLI